MTMTETMTDEAAPPEAAPLTYAPAPFWLIWSKNGHNPRYTHTTLASAREEAERLARLHPGRTFVIMEGVTKVKVAQAEGDAA